MKKVLIGFVVKALSVNLLLSLVLFMAYVLSLWSITFHIWHSYHQVLAIVFFVLVFVTMKSCSMDIVEGLKRVKAERAKGDPNAQNG